MDKFYAAGIVTTLTMAALTALNPFSKVALIGWIAFAAMFAGGVMTRYRIESLKSITWVYGISGGAALASIMFFVVPQAILLDKTLGVAGILLGFFSGLALHNLSHEVSHLADKSLTSYYSINLHTFAAGAIIGLIYNQMPTASILLGVAIVTHKLPAGYIVSDRIRKSERSWSRMLLLPAAAVGAAALLTFQHPVNLPQQLQAVFFGVSAGVFIHLALDFIPEPEPESHLRKLVSGKEDPLHDKMDEMGPHCIASTGLGIFIVTAAALLL